MTELKSHLAILHRNADLIDLIYTSKSVVATPDTERQLAKMETARILHCGEDGSYHLHPKTRSWLRDIYQQMRIFGSGTPIAEDVSRLKELGQSMRIAYASGDELGHDLYVDEMVDTILELQFSIDDQIRIFDVSIRNGYHDARTLDEKMKRNEFYQKRASSLSGAVSDLNSKEIRGMFDGPHAAAVSRRFAREIIARVDAWSARLEGLISEMIQFMNRSKEVTAQTKRYRAMVHALRTVSVSEQVEALEMSDVQMMPSGVNSKVRFDVRSEQNAPTIIEQARKLDPKETRVERRKDFAAGEVREAVAIPKDKYEGVSGLIEKLMADVRSGQTHSVREWLKDKGDFNPDHFVMDVYDFMSNVKTGVAMKRAADQSKRFTNGVRDVVLEPA
jgi:hypothetical protein